MIIYFVRHGESEATAMGDMAPIEHDKPLTEHGKKEAQAVADYFAKETALDNVLASTYQRAIQTAEPTAKHFGLPVEQREDLCERRWGVLKDLKWPEVAELLGTLSIEERYHYKPEGAESWADMDVRMHRVIDEIVESGAAHVAVFSHGGALRGVMVSLAGAEKSKFLDFTMDTGAIAKFDTEQKAFDFINLKP